MTIFPDYEQQLRDLARDRTPSRAGDVESVEARGSSWMGWPLRIVAYALPVLVAVAVVAVVLLSARNHPADQQHPSDTPSPAPAPAWLHQLAKHVSIFNSPPVRLPASIASSFPDSFEGSKPDLDLSQARRVPVSGATLWILPGRQVTCILLVKNGHASGNATCGSTAGLEAHGIDLRAGARKHPQQPMGANNPLRVQIAGLVPNGTVSVLIDRSSGPALSAVVHHNAFSATTTARILATYHIKDQPPYPTNPAGQTFGSAQTPSGRRFTQADRPNLLLVSGKALHRPGHVIGFVQRSQLNAATCANVKTPKQAIRCSQHEHPTTIPILTLNGGTVIGTFAVGQ